MRLNVVQSLHFKGILNRDNAICARVLLGPFKGGLLFGRFLKNFPWSPLCTFLENAGFGLPCKKCHNLAIRAFLDPLFAPKFSPVLALEVHTK